LFAKCKRYKKPSCEGFLFFINALDVSAEFSIDAHEGIIQPGAFVEYQDGSVTRLGLVRSTQVEAGMPEVWQTLGVQGHA
jgi:hypothetical protein